MSRDENEIPVSTQGAAIAAEHEAQLAELDARLANAEATIARILAHLDPPGTSKTLPRSLWRV